MAIASRVIVRWPRSKWERLPRREFSGTGGRRLSEQQKQARHGILAMLISVVLISLVGILVIEQFRFDVVDREFAARLTLLQRQRLAHPERKLFLVVGSSRMVMAFSPEQLPTYYPAGENSTPVTVFNFSHLGAGPVMNQMTLTRLDRAGIHPDWAILEVMPGFLPKENAALVTSVSTFSDVLFVHRYYRPGELWWEYLKHRTVGLPNLARRATGSEEDDAAACYEPLGGAKFVRVAVDPDTKRRLLAAQERNFGFRLRDLKVSAGNDRALRDSVRMLQRHGAEVCLLLSPEQEEFTRMYGPGKQAWFEQYIQQLRNDLQVPMIDARDWLEPQDFEDGHHALRRGQEKFTHRFGEQVIRPMIEGNSCSKAGP